MSAMVFNRAQFVVLLPIVLSNFLSMSLMRRRLNNKYGTTVTQTMDYILLPYIILFGFIAAILPIQIYFSFADMQNYNLNFKIYQLFDSTFECLFLWFGWTLKSVEMLMKVGSIPVDVVQEKLRRRQLVVSTLMIGYLSIKINDIFLYMVCGNDRNNKIVIVIEIIQESFNIFFFQLLKIFMILFLWKMMIHYMRFFFNEGKRRIFLFIHAVMMFSLVTYSNEFTYLAYIRINDFLGVSSNREYVDIQSMIFGFSKQTMFFLQCSAILMFIEYVAQERIQEQKDAILQRDLENTLEQSNEHEISTQVHQSLSLKQANEYTLFAEEVDKMECLIPNERDSISDDIQTISKNVSNIKRRQIESKIEGKKQISQAYLGKKLIEYKLFNC